MGGFQKLGDPMWKVPIFAILITVFGGLLLGAPMYGNDHINDSKAPELRKAASRKTCISIAAPFSPRGSLGV